MNYFARIGAISCMQYCRDIGAEWDASTFVAAASKDQIDTINFLLDKKCYYDSSVCAAAAANGHSECLKYLHEKGVPWESSSTVAAAASDNLEMFTYLDQTGCPINFDTLKSAAEHGLRCLEYLIKSEQADTILNEIEYGYRSEALLCRWAAGAGNLDGLKFLVKGGRQVSHRPREEAARGGHLDCLKYLCENGLGEWGSAFLYATQKGSAECVQYIIEHCAGALLQANKWRHSHGRHPLEYAVESNSIDCVA